MRMLGTLILITVATSGCSTSLYVGADPDLGGTCNVPGDCPINTGADCAQTCADGSNPCVNTCLNHQCAKRGCPSTDLGATTCAAAGGQCVALTATPGCPNGHIDGTYSCAVGGSCCIPSSDAGTCQPNGKACTTASQCCSNNCITRVSPGFCCEPGGCP